MSTSSDRVNISHHFKISYIDTETAIFTRSKEQVEFWEKLTSLAFQPNWTPTEAPVDGPIMPNFGIDLVAAVHPSIS
jgi:hypothetical protein